jgi:hypothetical protein
VRVREKGVVDVSLSESEGDFSEPLSKSAFSLSSFTLGLNLPTPFHPLCSTVASVYRFLGSRDVARRRHSTVLYCRTFPRIL